MKIERRDLRTATITLQDFAKQHGLVMEVARHDLKRQPFQAAFKNVEILSDIFLEGAYGYGTSENAAINDYAARISEKHLVVNAHNGTRVDIRAPLFLEYTPEPTPAAAKPTAPEGRLIKEGAQPLRWHDA